VRSALKPHVCTLQEVQSLSARANARLLHNPLQWIEIGLRPKSDGHGSAGTLVFVRRSRFKVISKTNRMLTPRIEGDRYHPERRLTKIVVEDRQTGSHWRFVSVHTWTKGRAGSNQAYVDEQHYAQVNAYVAQLRLAENTGQRGVTVGDWNEPIGDGGTYVESQISNAGMTSARMDANDKRVSLDEAYVTEGVKVLVYRKVDEKTLDTDHDGLYLELEA